MALLPKKNKQENNAAIIPKFISYGFVVMPLDGKKPILKNWNKLEKTPERLYIFENKNIGVLTGEASGITVLDIDLKDNGMKVWNCISSSYPEIITPMVHSPNGGLHIYFRYNKKLSSFSRFTLRGKKVGWDLLNNDRQAVVPPSVDKDSKKKYKWHISPDVAPIIEMPKWLEDYLIHAKITK